MNILNNSYIETDTRILRQNALAIMAGLPRGAQLIPVLKGDAYGLGLCGVAKALADLPGIGMFAVAHAAEGIALRDTGVKQDILVMGNPIPFQVEAAVAAGLTLTLGRTGLAETELPPPAGWACGPRCR